MSVLEDGMWMRGSMVSMVFMAGVVMPAHLRAQVPQLLAYHGYLENNGQPVSGDNVVEFRLWSAATSGSLLWSERRDPFTLDVANQGHFIVELGSVTAFPAEVFASGELWLETKVNASVLAPRMRLESVPYALHAAESDHAASAAQCLQAAEATHANTCDALTPSGPGYTLLPGNIGVGMTVAPDNLLQVKDLLDFDATHGNTSLGQEAGKTRGPFTQYSTGGADGTQFYNGQDTYVGHHAGWGATNTDSSIYARDNVGIGYKALYNGSGSWNVAVGNSALRSAGDVPGGGLEGSYNTAVGDRTLASNTTGSENAVLGCQAAIDNTSGRSMVAVGAYSLASNTTGQNNVAVGLQALGANTTGSNNIGIGYFAGNNNFSGNATGSGNIYIGDHAGAPANESNMLYIGNIIYADMSAHRLMVTGDVRVGTAGTNGCLQGYDGTALAGTCSSDERLKRNAVPLQDVLGPLCGLEPVSFQWKVEEFPGQPMGEAENLGLLAQQVETVMPDLVVTRDNGYLAVRYERLPMLLLAGLRELRQLVLGEAAGVTRLEEKVARLEKENQLLRAAVCELHPAAEVCGRAR